MSRLPFLDLGYTHESAAPALKLPLDFASPKPRGLALTARLRCLKALYDLERDWRPQRGRAARQAH